jgi:subtilisin family serine protease
MSFRILFITFIIFTQYSIAQVAPGKYWIEFNDKNNTLFSIEQPEAFLTKRAIERREKQNISIRENDLPVNPEYIQGLSNIGLEVLYVSKWFNAVAVKTSDSSLIDLAGMLPYVKNAKKVARYKAPDKQKALLEELMMLMEKAAAEKNNKDLTTLMPSKSAKTFDYGKAKNQIMMLNGDQLHKAGFAGEGILIAVFDAGFPGVDTMAVFAEMMQNDRFKGSYDFVDLDEMVFDANRHGMNVLSTMASKLPGVMTGTAPHADYWLFRTEEAASEFLIEECNWVRAMEYADSVGIDVVNSSLGYTTFDDPGTSHTYEDLDGKSTIITRAATIAASKGILVVNSAGNSGDSEWKYIGAPADADSILSIGASDAQGNYASFSSIGPSYDGRIKPNVSGQGLGATLASQSGGTISGNGTSFSAPIIAGLAACLWQANPEKSVQQIIKAIDQSSSQYSQPDYKLGYGIPNFALADKLLKGIKAEDMNRDSIVNVYPNPFNKGLTIEFYSAKDQEIEVQIASVNGKTMSQGKYQMKAFANNNIHFQQLDKLKDAAYVIKINAGKRSFARTILRSSKD